MSNNFRVVVPDEMVGNGNLSDISENIGWIYEEVFRRLEEQMPPILKFTEGETISIKQIIP